MPAKYDHINFKPPASVAKAAKRGLKMRAKQSKSNQGGTAVGLARANQLAKRETLSAATVKRMKAFFDRHQKNKKVDSGKKAGADKGQQAWLLWGGDAGRAWAKKVVAQMEKADSKKPVSRALNPCGMTKGGTFDKGNSCAGTKGTGKSKSKKITKAERNKALEDFADGKITSNQLIDLLLPVEERKSFFQKKKKPSPPTLSKPTTEGQKEFFKDSKVRDPSGKLLKVFHGTTMKFDVFTNPYGGWNMFSDNYDYSYVFAQGSGEVGEYYLNIKRPLDLRSLPREGGDARNELLDLLRDKAEVDEDSFNYLKDHLPYAKDAFTIINRSRDLLIEILIDHGYDGIVMPDVVIGPDRNEKVRRIIGDTYIAFVSQQIKKVTNENPTKANEIDRALNPCGMTEGGTFDKGNSCAGTKGTGKKAKAKTADQTAMTEWSGIDNAYEDVSVGEKGTQANEPYEIDNIRMAVRNLTNSTKNRTPEFIKALLEKEKAVWDKGVALLGGGEVELSKMDSEQVQELLQYIMDNDGGYFTSPQDFDDKLKKVLDQHKRDVETLKKLQAELDEYESKQPPKVEFKTGEPFVAKTYHGTPYGGFETFDKDQQGVNTKAGSATLGWFFAGSRETAQGYAGTSDDFPIKARGWHELGGTIQQEVINKIDKKLKTYDDNGKGVYASNDKIEKYINENPQEVAAFLAYEHDDIEYDTTPVQPEVKTAFIKMKNPFVVDQEKADYREQTYYDLMLKAIADGHDGIVITNTYDSGYYDTRFTKKSQLENIFAVFDKSSIKLLKERAVKRALNPCGMTEGGTFDKGNSCAGTKGTGKKKGKFASNQDGFLPVKKEQQKTKEFKRWFQNSEIVTDNGDPQLAEPIVLYHGTTHNFNEFNMATANPDNDMGRGFYFSDAIEDVEAYYGADGPDLSMRITKEMENILYGNKYDLELVEIIDDINDVLEAKGVVFDEEYNIDFDESKIDFKEIEQTIGDVFSITYNEKNKDAIEAVINGRIMNSTPEMIATRMAMGIMQGGTERVMQVYLRMNKPFYMAAETSSAEVKSDQTQLFAETIYEDEEGRLQEDSGFDMDSAFVSDMMGPAWDILLSAKDKARQYSRLGDVDEEFQFLEADIVDNEGISASDLIRGLKNIETLMYSQDDNGDLIGADIITEAIRSAGYDGIVYLEPSRNFNMPHIPKGTRHYIVFDPKQIKSATDNNGDFDPDNANVNRILMNAKNAIKRFTKSPMKKSKGKVGGCGNSGQGFVEGNTCAKGTKAGPVAGAKTQSKSNRPEGSHPNTTMFMDQKWAKDYVAKKELRNISDFDKAIKEDIHKLSNMNDVFVVPLDKDGKQKGQIVQIDRRMRKADGTQFDVLGLTSGEYRLEVIPIENSPTRKKGVETSSTPVRKDNLSKNKQFKKATATMTARQTETYAKLLWNQMDGGQQKDVAQYIAYKAEKQDFDEKTKYVEKAKKQQAAMRKKTKQARAKIAAQAKKQKSAYEKTKEQNQSPADKQKAFLKRQNARLAKFRREIKKFNHRTSPKELESKVDEFLSWQESMTSEQIGMKTKRTAKQQEKIMKEVNDKLNNQMVIYDLLVDAWTVDQATEKGLSLLQGKSPTKRDDDPCWKNYEQVGMKNKNGKSVPNCVPK